MDFPDGKSQVLWGKFRPLPTGGTIWECLRLDFLNFSNHQQAEYLMTGCFFTGL